MLDSSFWFDGIRGKEMGIELQEDFTISEPVPNVTTIKVPGRNGDLHYFDGSYQNRTATAPCFILNKAMQFDVDRVNQWLMKGQEYRKLWFESDPDHYLMARVASGISNKPVLNLLNGFDLAFDCKPQRYLMDGSIPIDITQQLKEAYTIKNPTNNEAFPLFVINGKCLTGRLQLYITDTPGSNQAKSLMVVGPFDGQIIFDAENNIVYGDGIRNDTEFTPPSKTFSFLGGSMTYVRALYPLYEEGGYMSIKIIPRWWIL